MHSDVRLFINAVINQQTTTHLSDSDAQWRLCESIILCDLIDTSVSLYSDKKGTIEGYSLAKAIPKHKYLLYKYL